MLKECKRCGQFKERSEFYKQKNTKDGLRVWCKECLKSYAREKYVPKPLKYVSCVPCTDCGKARCLCVSRVLRECTKCGLKKVLGDFNKLRIGRGGLHSWCRVCSNESSRAWNYRQRGYPKYANKRG